MTSDVNFDVDSAHRQDSRRTGMRKQREISALVLSVIMVLAILPSTFQISPVSAAVPSGFSDTLVAGNLQLPTAMEFAPDGRIFVSEKGGDVRVIKNGILLPEPFVSIAVDSDGERGLMGIAFDPDFMSNGYVYFYYTEQDSPIHNRVSRFTADPSNPDRAIPGSELPILDLEPLNTESHMGGGLEFGPDGKLYISVGDNYYSYLSQSLTSRFGKILRINPDGTIPNDNPFYNVPGAYKEIWALGLRNPFTFGFSSDAGNTRMYINDVGQFSREEINMGLAGANYGWPTCEGPCSDPQFIDPIYSYSHPTDGSGASIAGAAFYHANQFPSEYRGSFFFGDYVQGFIKRLTPNNQVLNFASNLNSPVDVEIGPDGSLYYLSIGAGQVRKVQYDSSGNNYPNAVASAIPSIGLPPLNVTFDGSGSSDLDNDVLTYSWNFGDGSPIETGVIVTHTYDTAGSYVAILTVSDGKGGIDTDFVSITVGNPPTGNIVTPAAGTTYNAGDTLFFSGAASDVEDGVLPPSAFNWAIVFHHNTHTHPFQQYSGVTSGSFTIPTVGESAHDVWYRIHLTVTDSDGLRHTSTRDILPNKANITLDSDVAGLQLLIDGQPYTTPHTFTGVVGISRTLEAPASQELNGTTYHFDSWSDGGSRIHTISTPATDTTFTAFFTPDISGNSSSSYTLRVLSYDLFGDEINGYYTTVSSTNGTLLATGFTPFTFTGTLGATYTVQVQDYGGVIFDHWEDGHTIRSKTITLNADIDLTAFYRTSATTPPSTYNLSVRSADLEGNTISGYYTVIQNSNETTVSTGFTPVNYLGTAGQTYLVAISDYGDATFDHWEDGSTDRTRAIALNTNRIITAYFKITPPPSSPPVLTVASMAVSGNNSLSGYYTTVSSTNGTLLATGFTPFTFTGTLGATYSVEIQENGIHVFDHWEDGSTDRTRNLTLDSNNTIIAYYREPAITVKSANLEGNTISGYYTVIRPADDPDTVQTGFTPFVYKGALGATYTVQVQDYGSFVFDHWEDGSTDRTRAITFESDITMTAYYRDTSIPPDGPILTIMALSMDNQELHMWTLVEQNSTLMETGFTPFELEFVQGTTYAVTVSNYQNIRFDHWEDGSTEHTRLITPEESLTITAYYTIG